MIDWTVVISITVSAAVSFYLVRFFNKKQYIYEIKKNTILKSMRYLDDYYAVKMNEYGANDRGIDNFTRDARECFNEIALTCENNKVLEGFLTILYPKNHGVADPTFQLYNDYRNLCRKELGNKYNIEFPNDTAFIGKIDPRSDKS